MAIIESQPLDIDFVYLWVDGNDPEQQESLRRAKARLGKETSPLSSLSCRFVDNQELRFSLRSLMANAPWIRKIHIVTNGQVPSWLDTEHPKIQMVFHKDIMPADALPTFNSEAIETCLSNIPDLTEHFLYGNDDCFIGRPTGPDFFFTEKGLPIVYGVKHSWKQKDTHGLSLYLKNIYYSTCLFKERMGREFSFLPSHNISPYRKSWLKACQQKFAPQFEVTCRQKFRAEKSVSRIILDYWALACGGSPYKEIDRDIKRGEILRSPLLSPQELRESFSSVRPVLFCINDNERTLEEDRVQLPRFMHELFPQQADWEKSDFILNCPEEIPIPSSCFAVLRGYLYYLWLRFVCSLVKGETKERMMHARSMARRRLRKTLFMRNKKQSAH